MRQDVSPTTAVQTVLFCLQFAPFLVSDEGGVRQEELVNWYLKEIESEIETVQELTDKKLLVEKVIDRLVHHVSHMSHPISHMARKGAASM